MYSEVAMRPTSGSRERQRSSVIECDSDRSEEVLGIAHTTPKLTRVVPSQSELRSTHWECGVGHGGCIYALANNCRVGLLFS